MSRPTKQTRLKVQGGRERATAMCLHNGRVRCPHNFRFLYLNLSRGTSRNWSVLAFRFASLPRPPSPATAQALTLTAIVSIPVNLTLPFLGDLDPYFPLTLTLLVLPLVTHLRRWAADCRMSDGRSPPDPHAIAHQR